MFELAKKEVSGFFSTLTGYIVISVFLLSTGLLLWIIPGENNIFENAYASLDVFFSLAPWLFLFLVPAISMRLIADEKRSGSIEFILTQPISNRQFILGKYFGGLSLIILALLPTFVYVLSVYLLGNPVGIIDMGATIGSYMGLFFLAAIYLSIGIFCSSLTENQIIAFILAVILSFISYLGFEILGQSLTQNLFTEFLVALGINSHYEAISKGLVNFSDIIYYFSFILFFIAATELVFKSKKW